MAYNYANLVMLSCIKCYSSSSLMHAQTGFCLTFSTNRATFSSETESVSAN